MDGSVIAATAGMRLDRRALLGAAAALIGSRRGLQAAQWPSRTLSILVGFGAGGVLDVLVRILADELRKDTGQPVVVENRPGASGMLAAGLVARAEPDGHTLLAMSGTITIAPALMKDLQIDVRRDLAPITLFATSPNVLVVRPDFPARTVAAFLAAVRAKPAGEFAYATSGRGTTVHFMAGMLEQSAAISMRHIPFRSLADSIRAVIGGDLPIAFSSINSALPFIAAGQVRAIGVASDTRSDFVPATETFAEAGIGGVLSDTWFGLAGGARLDPALVETIHARCAAVMTKPGIRERLAALGAVPLDTTPAVTKAQFDREVADFARLAARMNLTAE